MDRTRLEAAIREVLAAIGENPDEPRFAETPRRVADSWRDFLADRDESVLALPDAWANERDIVIMRDIDFVSVCEHHLLPFAGTVHVAYQPRNSILGFSDLPKLVRSVAAGLQLQEALTRGLVNKLELVTSARGVLAVVEARHGCMSDRGMRHSSARVVTVATAGTFDDPAQRAGTLALLSADTPVERGAVPYQGDASPATASPQRFAIAPQPIGVCER